MRPVAWAMENMEFSDSGYGVMSEPSQPSRTPGYFRRHLGLLPIAHIGYYKLKLVPRTLTSR
jgi:hypothetical protein